MNFPLIGITTNQDSTNLTSVSSTLSSAYVTAIRAAGGLPVMIPNEFPLDHLADLRSRLDGILFSGGGDIESFRFQNKDNTHTRGASPDRDELEIQLARMAVETDWPFLGICRGAQIINVALGGTLYTDIPTQYPTLIRHASPKAKGRDFLAHQVTLLPGSRLHGILQQEHIAVNSHHHQAVLDPAAGLQITVRAEDDLIEGFELPGHRFGIGVQWHPECLQMFLEQCRIFNAFIQAARV